MIFDVNNVITNIDEEKARNSIGLVGVFANDMKTLKDAVTFDYKSLRGTLKAFEDNQFIEDSGVTFTLFYPFNLARNVYIKFIRENFRYINNFLEPFEELKIVKFSIYKIYFDIEEQWQAVSLLHLFQSEMDTIRSNYLSIYNKKLLAAKNEYNFEYMVNYLELGKNILKLNNSSEAKKAVHTLYVEKIKQNLKNAVSDYYVIKKIYKSFNNLIYNNTSK